jgi:hypothetical protein
LAIERVLQCVSPGGVVSSLFTMIASTCSRVSKGLAPVRHAARVASFKVHQQRGRGSDRVDREFPVTATWKPELLRLKKAVEDQDQLVNEQLPNGIDGPVATVRDQ